MKAHPYTRQPGAELFLPGTLTRVVCYPTELQIDGITIPIARLDLFQVSLDLERGALSLFGNNRKQYSMQYADGLWKLQSVSGELLHTLSTTRHTPTRERLSFGSHRKQEWERIHAKEDLATFLPLMLRAGQWLPYTTPASAVEWRSILLSRFRSLLFPQQTDRSKRGLLGDVQEGASTLGTTLSSMRSTLLQSICRITEEGIHLLDTTLFPSGRLEEYTTPFGTLSLMWSEHRLRTLTVRGGPMRITLPKGVRRCRSQKRTIFGGVLEVVGDATFDRFEY